MPDRSVAPVFEPIDKIDFTNPTSFKLKNGLEVFCFDLADEDVIKIEMIAPGGKWNEEKLGVATVTTKLIKEGTKRLSSADFADAVDFYGATFQSKAGLHTANFTLFSLNKYLDDVLPLMCEALTEPAFRQEDLDLAISQAQQKLSINLEKVEYNGQRKFLNQLFGDDHPYGSLSDANTYSRISRENLSKHRNHFLDASSKIVVSGKLPNGFEHLLNQTLGEFSLTTNGNSKDFSLKSHEPARVGDDWPKAQQTAIRYGRQIINRDHPDFHGLQVVNTALGGYFGSRLMKNIREDKGYTYGIYSSLVTMPKGAYFNVSTEVGKQFKEATLGEIKFEIDRLGSEMISEQELATVKSNMLGNILEGIDGPFNLAGTYKSLLPYNLDFGYFYEFIEVIKSITPSDIQRLASQYFDPAEMTEITVG